MLNQRLNVHIEVKILIQIQNIFCVRASQSALIITIFFSDFTDKIQASIMAW